MSEREREVGGREGGRVNDKRLKIGASFKIAIKSSIQSNRMRTQ